MLIVFNYSPVTDKTQLVTDEKEPIQETTYVREQICGYDGLKFIIVSSILFAIAITVGMVFSIIFGPPQVIFLYY